MSKKTGLDFLNAFFVLWAKGIHPNWWKITETLIHKTKKMKYDPHFWPNMHQNWWNLSKMGLLTLAHGLWWVPLPKMVKTDPKNEIRVRQNSGKVIVLPKITQKQPILALKWYIWSFLEKMSWLTLAHGLWWVLLPKIVITDPKNEIGVRRSSGEVIVLP